MCSYKALSDGGGGSRNGESHANVGRPAHLTLGQAGVEPCTMGRLCNRHKFYDKYPLLGTGLFCQLQEAVESGENLPFALDQIAATCIEDEAWTAVYTVFNNTASIQIHAIHLAASLGSITLMEWIMRRFGSEILDRKAIIKTGRTKNYEPHYTPLMSAMFMSQVDAVVWLLDNNADATVANHDGFTPLHMLALFGLPHVRADSRLKAMQMVASKLVERGADLAASSGPLAHRKDENAKHERNKRPLEIAALKTCAYPKQLLHLLTKSYHCPEQAELFEEVHIISKANPSGAETLMANFKSVQASVTGQLKERLIQEVNRIAREGKHIDMLANIFMMSPVAGAELLGLLLCEPKVTDHHRYPLPLYNYLPNRVMRCTYQWVHNWDRGAQAPRWHSDFIKELPHDPLQHDHVYEVKVRVLAFPGVLNLKLLSIFSRVWYWTHHMGIFAQLPVQAITTCMWNRSLRTFAFQMLRQMWLLVVLLSLGIYPPGSDYVVLPRLFFVEIAGELMSEVFSIASGLVVCDRLAGIPRTKYLLEFHLYGFLQSVALAFASVVSFPIDEPQEKVVVAVNVLMACFILVTRLQAMPDLGPQIIAVLRSFAPMQNMFVVMVMVFVPFFCAFATIKDDERDLWYVGLYLYRCLFLSDGDASEALSGFDYGMEQKMDIGAEQFQGGHSQFIVDFSIALMVVATVLFSIVLLNLVIGMYSKFYDEMRPFAELLFHQQRAKACVCYLLSPGILQIALGASLKRYARVLSLSAAGCLAASLILIALPPVPWILPALLWAPALQLCQAVCVSSISNADENGKYLWISYRADYTEEYYMERTNQELQDLRRQVANTQAAMHAEMQEIKRLLLTQAFSHSNPGAQSGAATPRPFAFSL